MGELLLKIKKKRDAVLQKGLELPVSEWETEIYFDKGWMFFMRRHQTFMPFCAIEANKNWIEFIPDHNQPEKSTFRYRAF